MSHSTDQTSVRTDRLPRNPKGSRPVHASAHVPPIERVLEALRLAGCDPRETGSGWEARCPVHKGERHNLVVNVAQDGRVLLHCHGHACSVEAIVSALGLTLADLHAAPPERRGRRAKSAARSAPTSPTSNGEPQAPATAPVPPTRRKPTPVYKHPFRGAERALLAIAKKYDDRSWRIETGYEYPNANNVIVYVVYRFVNDAGEKEFRPFWRRRDGWVLGDPPSTRGPSPTSKLPLYQLPKALVSDVVYVSEGEKAADAIRRMGLTSTSAAHGYKQPQRTDWAPLAGKQVIIWPDHDRAGVDYCATVLKILLKLDPPPSIRVVRPAEIWRVRPDQLREKVDAHDWLCDVPPEGADLDSAGRLLQAYVDSLRFITEANMDDELSALVNALAESEAAPSQTSRLEPTAGVEEAPDDPHLIARTYVNECYSHPHFRTLVSYQQGFHEYRDCHHQVIPAQSAEDDLTAGIKRHFDRLNLEEMKEYEKVKEEYDRGRKKNPEADLAAPKKPVVRKVTTTVFKDTYRALRSMVSIPHTLSAPCWLREFQDSPDPRQILPTLEGLVDLSTVSIAADGNVDLGKIQVWDSTPVFFSPYVLKYRFDANAPKPSRWIDFLNEVFPGDAASQRELQKWFGYLISMDTSQQKMLYLIGKPRSGKGTIGRVLSELIGPSNVFSPALMDLADTHGLADAVGKTLMLISDARIAGKDTDLARLQEQLLKISGEDRVQINQKHKHQFTTNLLTRIVILSNDVPGFRDTSGAFRARMRPLRFLQSFEGREDKKLFDHLKREMPGILNWAITGRAMLDQDGEFYVPETAEGLVKIMAESATPIHLFLYDCCIVNDASSTVVKDDLYLVYRHWCARTGNRPLARQEFGKRLFNVHAPLKEARLRDGDERSQGYRALGLQPEVLERAREWEERQARSKRDSA